MSVDLQRVRAVMFLRWLVEDFDIENADYHDLLLMVTRAREILSSRSIEARVKIDVDWVGCDEPTQVREFVFCDICQRYFVVTDEQVKANCPECAAPFEVAD